ncbi:MAG: hypothetical protein WC438_05920 [Candidatus Pacearchaeota archaeon]
MTELDPSYSNVKDIMPEPRKEIDYIDSKGRKGTGIYLCACCKNEWVI